MIAKEHLRRELREQRRVHVSGLSENVRALLFLRPPTQVASFAEAAPAIGLYAASASEAPTRGYAKWFHERGKRIALPWFADTSAPMRFREWRDPYDETSLVPGPWHALQPADDTAEIDPAVVFVPLLGFTADLHRLGQGGGHYDRWLAAHPAAEALGLAWDCQLLDAMAIESHDRVLRAVITPTRIYGDI